jgi:uncharacterized membrane protein
MSLWLLFAVLSQAITALTVFIDKYVLVAKTGIKSPSAFAFYTAVLSGVVVVLLPFGVVQMPTANLIYAGLFSAVAYIAALLFLYHTLKVLSATNVIPITASAGAVTTGILAILFLAQDLPLSSIPAFLLLVVGTLCVYCFCFPKELLFTSLSAGVLFGVASFAAKLSFTAAPDFFTGIFWLLMMNVVVASAVLLPFKFKEITASYGDSSSGSKWLVLLSKALGGVAFFLTAIAIQQGSVSVVSALGGLQLVFLLIFVPLFAHKIPDVFKYELTKETLLLKVVGTVLIVLGLGLLFVPL